MVAETSDSRSWVEGFRGVRNSVGGLGLRGLGLLKLTGCAFLVGSRSFWLHAAGLRGSVYLYYTMLWL